MGSEILVYLRLGFQHIADLRGYDHILFITALTVAYRPTEWRRLLWLVTAFTVGHSITLALATLDLVRVSSRIVEPAIAFTIVITALTSFVTTAVVPASSPEPVSARGQLSRYALAGGFGLIHGLGFSTFLRSLLGGEESIVAPLLSFNVGLELGQLVIVLAVLAIGMLAERGLHLTRRAWVLLVSGGVTAVGLALIVDRL
jgi:hypothetical protein